MGLKDYLKGIVTSDGFVIGSMISFFAAGPALAVYFGISENIENTRNKEEVFNMGRITGTVVEEVYENRLESVPERHTSGLVSESFSNETVKLNSSYTLKVKKDNDGDLIGVCVIDSARNKKESLDLLVDEGSRISFPIGNVDNINGEYGEIKDEAIFYEDTQQGNKRVDRIRVLD